MRRFTALIVFASTCFLVLAIAAPANAQPGTGATPQHAKLKEMEGDWDAVVKMQGSESKGTSTFKLELGGMWLVSDFKGDLGGMPFLGKGIDGYDPAKKKYTSIWVDSMSSTFMISEGTYDSAGKVLTMVGEQKGPDGTGMKMKSVSEMKSADLMVFNMYMVGADGKDSPMLSIEYTRRKK